MSGHSKWSTIKRKKEANDAVRGRLFGKLSKAISIAAKEGVDPTTNAKLRVAIEQARNMNMPKGNIERAIEKALHRDSQLLEITYEGFGPGGVGIIVEAVTDNTRRTAQEIKSIFERGGGNLAGPNSVSFNFEPKGYIVFDKKGGQDELLSLIDLGVEDVEGDGEVIEVYVPPSEIVSVKGGIEKLGYKVKNVELVKKPKSYIQLEDKEMIKQNMLLMEDLEDNDDVQRVWTNAIMPEVSGN
jgi:YebC/PmpR family DNA-binding regulatory protein